MAAKKSRGKPTTKEEVALKPLGGLGFGLSDLLPKHASPQNRLASLEQPLPVIPPKGKRKGK
jgi:hypothetical protein